MEILIRILAAILVVAFIFGLWLLGRHIHGNHLFKKGRNPYHRICKKCGAHQEQFHEIERPQCNWWEEVYPIGNDPKCKCHRYGR